MLEHVVSDALACVRLILAPSAIDAASSRRGGPIHLCRSAVVNRQVSRLYGIFARAYSGKIQVSILLPNNRRYLSTTALF